jgi:hypothetical protein
MVQQALGHDLSKAAFVIDQEQVLLYFPHLWWRYFDTTARQRAKRFFGP